MNIKENKDLNEIRSILKGIFKNHVPPLQIRKDNENVLEASGTKETMQGKQKVDGFYFGSVVPKPKDIRLYYFPIYTHPDEFQWISDDLRRCLKGKSCFHIKAMNESLEHEIRKMIDKGVQIYLKENLI